MVLSSFLFAQTLLYTPTGLSDSPVHSLLLSPALAVSLHTGRFAWRWCTRVLLEKSPCTWTTRGHTAAFRFSARRFWLGLSNEESPFMLCIQSEYRAPSLSDSPVWISLVRLSNRRAQMNFQPFSFIVSHSSSVLLPDGRGAFGNACRRLGCGEFQWRLQPENRKSSQTRQPGMRKNFRFSGQKRGLFPAVVILEHTAE